MTIAFLKELGDVNEAKKVVLKALIGGEAQTSYDEVKEALIGLGLPSYEVRLYLFIVSHVPMSSSAIAKELDFDRSKVYRVVDNLIQKGLISQTLANPKLCIITDPATAIDGLLREWEERVFNGKKNRMKVIDYIQSVSIHPILKEDDIVNQISVLTSRYSVYYHIVSQLIRCTSNVIIYTSAVDLMRMEYTKIPELLYKISKTNTCTIIIDKDLGNVSKKYKGCKIIKIRKTIEGRIIIIEDELVIMSSSFNRKVNYKEESDINLSIKEPQIVRNMQQFIRMVLGQ